MLQNHNCMSAKCYLKTNKIHIVFIDLTRFIYFTQIWKCYLYHHEISNSKSEFTKWYIWSTDEQLGRYTHSTCLKVPYIAKRNRKSSHTEKEETYHGKIDALNYLQQPRLKYVCCAGTVCACVCVFFQPQNYTLLSHYQIYKAHDSWISKYGKHFKRSISKLVFLHLIMIINRMKWKAWFKILTGMYILTIIYTPQKLHFLENSFNTSDWISFFCNNKVPKRRQKWNNPHPQYFNITCWSVCNAFSPFLSAQKPNFCFITICTNL